MAFVPGKSFSANIFYARDGWERPIDCMFDSYRKGEGLLLVGKKSTASKLRFEFGFKETKEDRHLYYINTSTGGRHRPIVHRAAKGYVRQGSALEGSVQPWWKIELIDDQSDSFCFHLRDEQGHRVARYAEQVSSGELQDYLNTYEGEDIITFRARNILYR